jgi:hypothetical protein
VENKRSSLELVDLLECEALILFKLLGVLQENWLIFYGCNLLISCFYEFLLHAFYEISLFSFDYKLATFFKK